MIARRFYDKGEISLEVACHDIDQWPLPIPGNTLDLPLLGHLMQVYFNTFLNVRKVSGFNFWLWFQFRCSYLAYRLEVSKAVAKLSAYL